MKKNLISNPVFGQVYMASRYHNSKRIVWEPFRVESDNGPAAVNFYKFRGTWIQDNVPGSAGVLKEFEPKWVERKIKELNDEASRLAAQVINLRHIQPNGL